MKDKKSKVTYVDATTASKGMDYSPIERETATTPIRDERIDLVLDITKFTAHFFMLGLCFFNIFASDVPILEDVWTVLLGICLFRMVELGDKR